MDNARTVNAQFAAINTGTFTLSVSVNGNGSVSSQPAGIGCGSDCSEDYLAATSVTLTATPDSGFAFQSWSGQCFADGAIPRTSFVVDQNRACTANFQAATTLSVSVVGEGQVNSSPPDINCGADCTETYSDLATFVSLTALPIAPAIFVGWTGDCVSSNSTFSVSMAQSHACTASFSTPSNPVIVTLNIYGAPGSVLERQSGLTCAHDGTSITSCLFTYEAGTTVLFETTTANRTDWLSACDLYPPNGMPLQQNCHIQVNADTTLNLSFR